jgi:putative redox protein
MADAKVQVKSAKYTMVGEAVSHSRTDISVRDVKVITDEPLERGGTNAGASPTETMMAALVGCTNNVATRIAHHQKLNFEIASIECDVEFDRRGVILAEPIDVPFPNITLTINVKTDATPEQLAEVEKMLPIYCPVSKVFRQAGSNVIEKWNVVS